MSTRPITSRNDLSFTGLTADNPPRRINWAPVRVPLQRDQWNKEYDLGLGMAEEVRALHTANEMDAFLAIQLAFNDPAWKVTGAGAELGFAAGIAALAIVGMRALEQGAAPFDPEEARRAAK
ncbi:hypothetical protein [Stutzerimonas azotifigens]|uniref:hypothetical protein n=1 Tax=Stutzerimonas azotifigens TaxID=291995 RepID=UPI0004836409|nr:hypothetical protein [Stutzerimonas azotifigens]